MKSLIKLVLPILFVFSSHAYSHSDHGAAPKFINESQAISIATSKLKNSVKSGDLDKNWSDIVVSGTEFKRINNQPSWVVTFVNLKENNQDEKQLVIYLAGDGAYLAMEFEKG